VKRVLVACNCVGGTNSVKPVIELLAIDKDVRITWAKNENEVMEYLGRHQPSIGITSPCSGVGRFMTQVINAPTVAIQNQWRAGLDIWDEVLHKPEYIFVNDELDKQIVLDVWPPEDQSIEVIVTGYPAMDQYADFDVEAARSRAGSLGINVSGDFPIVLFAGQWWHTGQAIMETVDALNAVGKRVNFIPRMHPNMAKMSYEEMPAWKSALAEFRLGNLVLNSGHVPIEDLIATATVVVSMFSTVLQEAAILQKQNIAILYPDTGASLYKREAGLNVQDYPLVSLGCTTLVQNRDELIDRLMEAMLSGDGLGLQSKQKEAFLNDGKNTQRAVDFIRSLI
jgi:hypothetical protein